MASIKRTRSSEPASQQDLQLLARVTAGEERAWVEFCSRFEIFVSSCVGRVLRRYAVQLNAETLEDLVAEVWVALLRDNCRKLRLYDASRGCRLTTWIGMIATNTVIDYLRVKHTPSAYLEDRPQVALELVDDASQPDVDLELQQRAEIARRAIARLKAEEQRFVQYCFAEEWRPTKIAREMGISINTVHSRKFKLRKKLTQLVAQIAVA